MGKITVNRVGALASAAIALLLSGCGDDTSERGPIVYQASHGLEVVQADGSGTVPLLPPSFGFDARHADWAPDGSRVVFAADEPDAQRDIWLADGDGFNVRKLFNCRPPCHDADSPAWSRDGTKVAFVTRNVAGQIDLGATLRTIDVASRKVTTVVTTQTDAEVADPRWSPDGNRIVVDLGRWSSSREDASLTGSAIGVVDLRAAKPTIRRITSFASFASFPDWHPSKDLILMQAGADDPFVFSGRPSNLFTIEPDGTGLKRLTARGAAHPWIALPTWSPDGSTILVTLVHDLGDHTLATVKPDGSHLTEIIAPDTGDPVAGAHARQAAAKR